MLARVHAGLDLVDLLARQLRTQLSRKLVHEELVSYGNEGLLAAARSFDESRGVPFRVWGNLKIRGAMLDGLRSSGELPRGAYRKLRALRAADAVSEVLAEENAAKRPQSPEEADARLDAHLASIVTALAVGLISTRAREGMDAVESAEPTPEEAAENAEIVQLVKDAVTDLPVPERHIVERHYFADATIEQAAGELGLSKSWGSRLHARAVQSLSRGIARRSTPKPRPP